MIKKCKVLLNNDAVSVVEFDGKKIQIPPIGEDKKEVAVLLKDGKYKVVDDNYTEATFTVKKEFQNTEKKTTIKNDEKETEKKEMSHEKSE